jgi:hypothetical protein
MSKHNYWVYCVREENPLVLDFLDHSGQDNLGPYRKVSKEEFDRAMDGDTSSARSHPNDGSKALFLTPSRTAQ